MKEPQLKKVSIVTLLIATTLILFSVVEFYRWEEVDVIGMDITKHINYSYTEDCYGNPQECGWVYYKDRLTGLTKAVHLDIEGFHPLLPYGRNEYSHYFIIYEKPFIDYIERITSLILSLLSIALFISIIVLGYAVNKRIKLIKTLLKGHYDKESL